MTRKRKPSKQPAQATGPLPIMTTKEAAAYIRKKATTLRIWRSRGVGPRYSKPDGVSVLYKKADLDSWIEGGLRSSTTDAPEELPA